MSGIETDGYYEAYWPATPKQTKLKALAPRLDTLAGKKIALLWGYLFRGEEVFGMLEPALKARYPDIRFVSWREFGSIHGNNEHEVVASLPRRFKELGVDGTIAGMGC